MTLNYTLMLTLTEMALRKVVVMMWSEKDILYEFNINTFGTTRQNEEIFEKDIDRVKTKLSEKKLALAKPLLDRAIALAKIVGEEISNWKFFHSDLINFPHAHFERKKQHYFTYKFGSVKEKLSWTSFGTINYQKTAEEIIRCEMLNYFLLYKLACMYCLEDLVPVLWEKLPRTIKDGFYDRKDRFQLAQSHLDAFWTGIIRKEDYESDYVNRGPFDYISNFYQNSFEVAAKLGSLAATKYFYKKLTHEEKESSLLNAAKAVAIKDNFSCDDNLCKLSEVKYTDVLCYLLSQMIPETRIELFRVHSYGVLSSFLVWPWQDLFLDVAQLTIEFLPESMYCYILEDILIDTVSKSTKLHLFLEFFRRGPENLKSYFIDQECLNGYILETLFSEYLEIVKFFFQNIDDATRWRLVFCNQGYNVCCNLIKEDKWNLLRWFIGEKTRSKEDMRTLKENLKLKLFEEPELLRKFDEWERSILQ